MAAWVVPAVMAAIGMLEKENQARAQKRAMAREAIRTKWSPFITPPAARERRLSSAAGGAVQGGVLGLQVLKENPWLMNLLSGGGGEGGSTNAGAGITATGEPSSLYGVDPNTGRTYSQYGGFFGDQYGDFLPDLYEE